MADFETRLRQLEDREELRELVARYGQLLDDRDLDGVAELYASDAVFESRGGPLSGRTAVVDYYRNTLGSYGGLSYHYPHSQVIEFDSADSATGVVAAHAEMVIGGAAFVVALRYHDRYRREDGRWRFLSRKASQLYALPLAELATGMAESKRKRWPGSEPQIADLPEQLSTWKAFHASLAKASQPPEPNG